MKRMDVLILIIVTLFFLGGCHEEKERKKEEALSSVGGFPLKVVDYRGNELMLKKKPEKIVSMTLASDEILLSMVEPDRISALSCRYADDETVSNVAESAKGFEKVEDNIESIVAMAPDLVFTASWMSEDKVSQLIEAGIPVYCYKMPSSIDGTKKLLSEIGRVVGEEKKADHMISEMKNRLNPIFEKISTLKEEEKLTVLMYDAHGGIAMFSDIAEKAGVINLFSQSGVETWGNLSKEKIVELNPDIFVIPAWSFRDLEKYREEIINDPSFVTVNAVKNNRIYELPSKHINCLSHYVVYGVEDLARAAYPELFEEN